MPEMTLPAVVTAPRTGPLARLAGLWRGLSRPYAALEARRNRVLYAGWPLVIAGTLPLAAGIAKLADIPVGHAVSGALLAWATIGLPITAVLFGAVAGAGLRTKADEDEAALPVAPTARALGALGAAAAAYFAIAAALLAATFAFSPDAAEALKQLTTLGSWQAATLTGLGTAAVAGLGAGWLLTVSFLVAYAASHAVLGGVAALFAAALAQLPLAAGVGLQLNAPGYSALPFLAASLACGAAGLGGALACLRQAAPLAARRSRRSWLKMAFLGALPLVGSLGAWPVLFEARHRVLSALEQVHAPSDPDAKSRSELEKYRGGLYRGYGGRLVLHTGSGDVVLLEGSAPSVGEMARGKESASVNTAFRDDAGRIWAEVFHRGSDGQPSTSDIYVGDGKGRLRRYVTIPGGMSLWMLRGQAAVNTDDYSYSRDHLVPLDPAKVPILRAPEK